ncbi:MAG: hypothetical protein KGQ28_10680, partial [Hyphomicrobiales bacterium]|nr:hypothetical protein [Hyphomicrobiales bacterium]
MSPDPVAVDPARLREARVQAHCAAQWLARAARSYLPARDDDGQTNLGWDGATRALTTHPIANRRFALTIAPLALTVGRVAPMALQGLDDAGVRERFGRVVAALGL